MKTCRKCKVEKPPSDFGNLARSLDGLQTKCRACKNADARNDYAVNPPNPEKASESSKKYYAANRESRKEYSINYRVENREKVKESQRNYRVAYPEKVKESDRRCRIARDYGISSKDFEQMKLTQGGACAICKVVPKKRLHIDHDHSSGRVRALLCSSCNLVLGHLKDSAEKAESMASYLRAFNEAKTNPPA